VAWEASMKAGIPMLAPVSETDREEPVPYWGLVLALLTVASWALTIGAVKLIVDLV
jgi:hypothetical protein